MADSAQMNPELAATTRRAAALLTHWRRKNEASDIQATAREFFAADVLVRGKPMTPWHIEYGQPDQQPE